MKRAKKTDKKTNLKTLVFAGFVCVLLFTYAVDKFFDSFTFEPPVEVTVKIKCFVCRRPISPVPDKIDKNAVITPLPTEKITPTTTPKVVRVKTEKEIIDSYKHATTLWKVYQLETQRGKTDFCRLNSKGFGGFGVKSSGKIVCYESFEKAVERAEYWLIKNGLEKNLVNALCTYNLGHNRNERNEIVPYMNCKYYQYFLKV